MTPRRRRIKFWRWARRRCHVLPEELVDLRELKPAPKYFYNDPVFLLWYSDRVDFTRRVDKAMDELAKGFREAKIMNLFGSARGE